jgi:hypothetical protein
VGTFVKQRYMLSVMCGRSTYKLTWEEIVALYRLTLDQPARNTQARYNWHLADIQFALSNVRFWGNIGHPVSERHVFDPKRTSHTPSRRITPA